MSYGTLNDEQRETVRPFLTGERVMDLGCEECGLSKRMLDLGAAHVVGVDKTSFGPVYRRAWSDLPRTRFTFIKSLFHNLKERERVAFVSWPINHPVSLAPILADAEIVIYLGKNTDGTVCGAEALWNHLREREVLAHVPDRGNTLIVYGPTRVEGRDLLPEEFAGVNCEILWGYDEIHGDMKACEARVLAESVKEPDPFASVHDRLWSVVMGET